MQEAWGYSGLSCPANGERLSRALVPLLHGAELKPQPMGWDDPMCAGVCCTRECADMSGGSSCGKEFFCVPPGEHLPWVPSHCLTSTGFIPLLSLANHALKHVRRACTTFSSSSSTYRWEHLAQRHPRIGKRLKFCSAEMCLSEELTFVFNTCSPDLSLSPVPALPCGAAVPTRYDFLLD